MSDISAALREIVVERAGNRCEYCHLAQAGQEASFHLDHIQPRAAAGPTLAENLALACVSCSLHKSARQSASDPDTGLAAPLFHPRNDRWSEHFIWEGEMLVGITPIGRATVVALHMNRPLIRAIRREETHFGRHPIS